MAIMAIMAFVSWWSAGSYIEKNIESRFNLEASAIESGIQERIQAYSVALLNSRGFIRARVGESHAETDRANLLTLETLEEFRSYIKDIEVNRRFPGIQGIGFAAIFPENELYHHLSLMKRKYPNYQVRPDFKRPLYSAIMMLEPEDERNQRAIGFDMMSETQRRTAIEKAIETGEPTLTTPVYLVQESKADRQPGFLIFVPVYKGVITPESVSQRKERIRGLVYAPLRSFDFIEGIFGRPNLKNEKVNFNVSVEAADGSDHEVYRRFDSMLGYESEARVMEKVFSVQNIKFKVKVQTLPSFFTFTEKVLQNFVGFVAVLVTLFIFVFLRATQKHIEVEERNRGLADEARERDRQQAENLERLIELSRDLMSETELNQVVKRFFNTAIQLSQAESGLMYHVVDLSQTHMRLAHSFGVGDADQVQLHLDRNSVRRIFHNKSFITSHNTQAPRLASMITPHIQSTQNWVAYRIDSREGDVLGVLFLAHHTQDFLIPRRLSFLESLTAQAAVGIENATLFERANEANRAKSSFLANMSHEIRTPLGAIIGFSDILSNQSLSADQRKDLISNIRKNGEQLTRIIDDILDLSKVEAGKLFIDRRRVDLPLLLHEIKSVMDLRARDKGIEFSIALLDQIPKFVITDEIRLKQILHNIIGNAIKFTHTGSVQLSVRHADSAPENHHIEFVVRDTGVGISYESQKDLFKPFSQGDNSATRAFGGTGLGLVLSKKLAQNLGGDIELMESVKGSGSTFRITIDTGEIDRFDMVSSLVEVKSQYPPKELPLEPQYILAGKKILLVEDSEDNQEIFMHFLLSAGAKVELVDNGLDAVERGSQGHFDLILMDIQIPHIDGKEATKRLRMNGYKGPIVALTAHAMPEERESCIQAGCDGQITKPVTGFQLISESSQFLVKGE